MALRDLIDNIQYGLEEVKDKLSEIKDNVVFEAGDVLEKSAEGLIDSVEEVRDKINEGQTPFSIISDSPIGALLTGPRSEIIGSFLKGKVHPEPGSIVICKIAGGLAEHSGVYIGKGKIVELNGSGDIRKVSLDNFLHDGPTRTGANIYVACDGSSQVLCDNSIAARAESMIGRMRDYHVIIDNCHQFTTGCITGEFDNVDNFYFFLAHSIRKEMNSGDQIRWLICDMNN